MLTLVTNPKILPTCVIVLSVLAAACYAYNRDFRHVVYWASTALLVASITY